MWVVFELGWLNSAAGLGIILCMLILLWIIVRKLMDLTHWMLFPSINGFKV